MIDVSVLVGASPRLQPSAPYNLEAAVHELRSHDISTALVAARGGASYRAEVGNDIALAAAGSSNGVELLAVGTLNPRQYLDWSSELDRVLSAGVVALRFFPDVQQWTVDSEVFRTIVDELKGRRPILMPMSKFGDASTIGAATERLDQPVVLIGAHYTQLADGLAALQRWPHLHLETSCLGQFRGVETVVAEVGADRLLFGSGTPLRPIQAPLNAVLTAAISEQEKHAILAGNACRLFGLSTSSFDLPEPTHASDLIDIHGHIGALGYAIPPLTPHEYVSVMRQSGVQRIVASSLRAIVDDASIGNVEAFNAGAGIAAYVVVNPNDPDGSCRAMDDAFGRDLAVGVKLHCSWSGQSTTSRSTLALVREIAKRGRPLEIHVDGPDWDAALATVANEFPDWKMIVAHAGPGTPSREAACLVSRTNNVFVELATTFPDLAVIREVVARVGPGRLLFGTDAPLIDPAYMLGIYADAGVDLPSTSGLAREVFGL